MTTTFNKDGQKNKQSAASATYFFFYRGAQLALFVIILLLCLLFPGRVSSNPNGNQNSTLVANQPSTWEPITGKGIIHLPGYGIKKIRIKTKDTPEPRLVVPEKD